MESILKENKHRFVIFPIQYDTLWDIYKRSQNSFWVSEHVDLSLDIKELHKLNEQESVFIRRGISWYIVITSLINENIAHRFMGEVQIPEARTFYGFQLAIGNIHSEMHHKMYNQLTNDELESINVPSITNKIQWVMNWMNSDATFAQRLIIIAITETIYACSIKCFILWIKSRNILPALCFYNDLISSDKDLHCEFTREIYMLLLYTKLEQEQAYKLVQEAVNLEKIFISENLKIELDDMNILLLHKFVEYTADELLVEMKYDQLYRARNPFNWFKQNLKLNSKVNRNNHDHIEYDRTFTIDVEF